MIDKDILDQVIPLPELEERKEQEIAQLKEDGFAITNFHSGGIFYTLLMATLRIERELILLARSILNNMFLAHATGPWLDLKASDYTTKRKPAQKAQGMVTLTREEGGAEAVKIEVGQVFKTEKDIIGDELRYFVIEAAVLRKGDQTVDVLVEAETEGSRYNVPQGQITKSLTAIAGIGSISNRADWITQAGGDVEDDEGLRDRSLSAWAGMAKVPLRDTYANACKEISGVLYVDVDDHHPRGQGTVDIIVTSEAGAASDALLDKCRAIAEGIKEPDSDVLVKSAEVVTKDISVTVTVPNDENQDGLKERVEASVVDLMQLRKRKRFYELTHADIIYKIKDDISSILNVTVTAPAADVSLSTDKVIMPGKITITVQGV